MFSGTEKTFDLSKWKLVVFFLVDAGLAEGDIFLAKNCYTEAEDIQSLFLLSQAIGYEEGFRDVRIFRFYQNNSFKLLRCEKTFLNIL